MELTKYKGLKYSHNEFCNVNDSLIVEHPLTIKVNQQPFTVTMQTPGNELNLVRGLLFTENVYSNPSVEIKVSITKESNGYIDEINALILDEQMGKGAKVVRNQISVSSCGICGISEWEEKAISVLKDVSPIFKAHQLFDLFIKMNGKQTAFIQSGGSHASAAFDQNCKLLTIQEDVGRHNAVDKVIGHLIESKELFNAKCILVSGRISYEIVNKCITAQIPILAAVSAPTSLAVELANKAGITLIGFCRDEHFTIYSHENRISK